MCFLIGNLLHTLIYQSAGRMDMNVEKVWICWYELFLFLKAIVRCVLSVLLLTETLRNTRYWGVCQ